MTQTRAPDQIVIVADTCSDRTVDIARGFGRRITVIETVGSRDRKVGALRTAWQQYVAFGYDYMLDVDADTVLSGNTLQDLETELEQSPKVGGVMARYTVDVEIASTRWARLLIRMQRMEFAAWTLDMLHRKRSTYVLGGQATLFRVVALQEVVDSEHRLSPWDPEAQSRGHGTHLGVEGPTVGDRGVLHRSRLRRRDGHGQITLGSTPQMGRRDDPAA